MGRPIAVGAVSAAGLVTALLGDGVWDLASWVALAVPVLACGLALRRRGKN